MSGDLTRCKQRMGNFTKALGHLRITVEKGNLNEIEKAGLIQFFEVAFELAWKAMKDYLLAEGYDVKSPRDAIKTAFDYGLIDNGAKWLEALEKRNLAAHTYDESILDALESLITREYYPMMTALRDSLQSRL